ncbi:hypothetical protein B0T22DRAFT_536257 [Podospora appendiculata]|uniref:C2H2-type domain-containing protein n=1 Tax=Podospora appendiculata TaxID=314037 RepID=A0AAE1CD81_9PEZI|nr:hypothetical protein B0T22DRAFT_536257 [Podospora appendiculata]
MFGATYACEPVTLDPAFGDLVDLDIGCWPLAIDPLISFLTGVPAMPPNKSSKGKSRAASQSTGYHYPAEDNFGMSGDGTVDPRDLELSPGTLGSTSYAPYPSFDPNNPAPPDQGSYSGHALYNLTSHHSNNLSYSTSAYNYQDYDYSYDLSSTKASQNLVASDNCSQAYATDNSYFNPASSSPQAGMDGSHPGAAIDPSLISDPSSYQADPYGLSAGYHTDNPSNLANLDTTPTQWQQLQPGAADPHSFSTASFPTTYGDPAQYRDSRTAGQTASTSASPPENTNSGGEKPFRCGFDGCNKAYELQYKLTKHQNNHTRPRTCDYCPPGGYKGGAEMKDLNRHIWTFHPTQAKALGTPKDEDECPNCDYKGRSDNVKRHRKKHNH